VIGVNRIIVLYCWARQGRPLSVYYEVLEAVSEMLYKINTQPD